MPRFNVKEFTPFKAWKALLEEKDRHQISLEVGTRVKVIDYRVKRGFIIGKIVFHGWAGSSYLIEIRREDNDEIIWKDIRTVWEVLV